MDQITTVNGLVATEGAERAEAVQYIVVRLGKEQYGIDIKYIENIVRMQRITRIPKVANYLMGVINLRGEVLPVMSIRLRMGLEADEITRTSRIIILKTEQEGNIGVLVDEVKEVITLESADIEKITYNANDNTQNFLSGVGKRADELVSLFDINTITLEDNNKEKENQ